MKRISWDEYFLQIVEAVSQRSTCDRAQVGAVLVQNGQIVSSGYNGSPSGHPHCDQNGHDMVDGHCIRTVHAELNAILQAAKSGTAIYGATCYTTYLPCYECSKALVNVGIKRIVFREIYRMEHRQHEAFLQRSGITLDQLTLLDPSLAKYMKENL